jgi:hypothetical protein
LTAGPGALIYQSCNIHTGSCWEELLLSSPFPSVCCWQGSIFSQNQQERNVVGEISDVSAVYPRRRRRRRRRKEKANGNKVNRRVAAATGTSINKPFV